MKPLFLNKITMRIIISMCVVTAITFALYWGSQSDREKNKVFAGQYKLEDAMAKIAKLIVLPETEIPTMATVADPTVLKDQPFFAGAESGDIVLMYAKTNRVILYSPEKNKIINVK